MAKFPSKPQHGKSFVQEFGNSINQIIDYLPSLEVRGDQKSTYVTKSSKGTVIHATEQNPSTKGKEYFAGSGLILSGNTFHNAVTSGRFIEVTSAYAINCTLSGGRDIQITQGGIINYTGSGGGGASGYTYTGDGDLGSGHIFVDYSYTNPVICSNLCYIDDLLNYPISGDGIGSEPHFVQIKNIKDGAGTQVDYHWTSIGDSTEEGGQLIKFIDGVCVNLNVSGGTYITTKFHQGVGYGDYTSASIDCNLSGDRDINNSGLITIVPQYDIEQNITGGVISSVLHAGSGIAIDPQTGEITCTVEGGGGGNTYYADNFTLSTTSPTGNTFYLYDVYPLLTGRGGISVDRYGDAPLYPGYALGTVISCPVYLPSTGIAILDDTTPGTQNKYVAITADFDYNAGTGISIDPVTRTINCTVEPGGGETYYADESTIKLSSTNNTFYLYDVEPLLTGAGGIKVYNYGLDGLSRRVTGISATPYTGGDNISVDNYVISMTATIPTKTSDLTNDSHFITINDVPPGSVYQGDNVTIAASGTNNNIFYVIDGVFAPLTTVVNLSTELSGHIDYVSSNIPLSTSELVNDVPFVTSGDLDAYYKVSAFNAVGDHLQYVPRLGRLNCTLTGGDWIQIDEQDNINCTLTNVSDLNNDAGYITTVDIPPSTTYIGTSGIAIETILDENLQSTTSSNIYISASFYNTLTNPISNRVLSCSNGILTWAENTGGSPSPTPTPGGNTSQFALTSGAFSAEVNSEMIILTPTHIGNYDYPFKFWGFDQNNNFACGDEYPPSAVTAIDTLLNMTLTGSMFGYWNTSYQADVAIVLPNPTGPCTVKVKGFGSTWIAIVSNGKKIFSDITYYNPETFDNFANYPDETFEVSYYIDYMDCYSQYKQYLYLYVNSATGWAYNPNFYEHMVSAINEDGGCWIRTEIK